ncbi:MAG: alpha/beta fold hydrolase [Ilumatobacteraceae bacterium]
MGAPEEMTFEHRGLTFRATLAGPAAAPPVILLHGFPGSRQTWRAVVQRLTSSGVRTAVLEQRGYGPSARPNGVDAYRLPELSGDVMALTDRLGADRYHLVGHDWGGIVAWHLAATQPSRWASLTVLSTPHPRAYAAATLRSDQGLRSGYVAAFQLPLLPELLLTVAGGRLLQASLRSSGLNGVAARQYADHLSTPSAMRAALNWYRASFRHPSDLRDVGDVTVPTTYVWSSGDTALGRAAAERTASHVRGQYRFVVLHGVSHWIPETRPARTAELIVASLGKDPSAAR